MPPGREVSLEVAWNFASAAFSRAAFGEEGAKRALWILFNWVEFCQQAGLQVVLRGDEYVQT
jgi:hypothetical protein